MKRRTSVSLAVIVLIALSSFDRNALFRMPTSLQARAVHTLSGQNRYLITHRYGCTNPACKAVREEVKKWMSKLEGVLEGDLPKVVIKLTTEQQQALREGNLAADGTHSAAIRHFLKIGVGFRVTSKR